MSRSDASDEVRSGYCSRTPSRAEPPPNATYGTTAGYAGQWSSCTSAMPMTLDPLFSRVKRRPGLVGWWLVSATSLLLYSLQLTTTP